MNHIINASIQIVPKCSPDKFYAIIDAAIEVIKASGLRNIVTPLETVLEGPYDEVMLTIKKAQEASLASGAEDLALNIRMHVRKNEDVSFEEKTSKY